MGINTSVQTTLDKIIIDGNEISGYSDYFVLNELTYTVEPVRSANGIMENLNGLTTFIVPRLFIDFNYLNVNDFRKLISIINSKNEYTITYLDQNDGVCYTRPFYLKPTSRSKIHTIVENGDAIFKGIKSLSLEFVCTLRDLEEKSEE